MINFCCLTRKSEFFFIYARPVKLLSHEFDLKSSTALEHTFNQEGVNQLGINEKNKLPQEFYQK